MYGIAFTIEKNEIMPPAATWMDPQIIILSKVSHKEKDKYHMISLGVIPIRGSNPPLPQMFKLDLEKAEERSNCQYPLNHQKSKRVPEKHPLLLY